MSRIIYMVIIFVCSGVTVFIYKEDIKRLFPKEKIKKYRAMGEKSISQWVMKSNNLILDRELFSSSVILKNLSLVRKETPLSADYIYENLMNNSTHLKPLYSEMLTLYRSGRDEEAFKVFALAIGTKAAKNFALILSKLDKINPSELTEQMEIFQEMMTERNMTGAMKRAQRNSLVTTAFAVATVFALLINFAVVVVFMDTINLLNNMFI